MPDRIVAAVMHHDAVRANDVCTVPWWSFTKTVLAAAALVLVERRRLNLDEPVNGDPFTLRQLLQHRAGLADYGSLDAYHLAVDAEEMPWPEDELLRRVPPPLFEPGRDWAYSNVGYLLVRTLIERATGEALGAALRRLVLEPLGVEGAKIASAPEDLDDTAWGNARGYHPGWVYHGLMIGRPADAVTLLHRLLGGELLSAPLLAEMCDAFSIGGGVPGRPWTTAGYGLGLMIGMGEPCGKYVGHSGAGPGSTAAVYARIEPAGRSARSAAAFAESENEAIVERFALGLAHGDTTI